MSRTPKLAAALSAAQGEMGAAAKDSKNPFFNSKYADLASVWEACRGPLSKHGLAVIQKPTTRLIGTPEPFSRKTRSGEERFEVKAITEVTVTTILLHDSGEAVDDSLSCLLAESGPQPVGSAITYLRRYGLMAMVGIAPDDDDGNEAQPRDSQERRESSPKSAPRPAQRTETPKGAIASEQIDALGVAIKASGLPTEEARALLKKVAGVESRKEVPVEKFQACLDAFAAVGQPPAEPYKATDSDTEWLDDKPTQAAPMPECPKCKSSKSVIADKFKPGRFKCWEKARVNGCGHSWQPGGPQEEPGAAEAAEIFQ